MKIALFLIPLFLMSCLKIEDTVVIQPEGQATWSVSAWIPAEYGHLYEWESVPEIVGLLVDSRWDIDSMENRTVGIQFTMNSPGVMQALDSSGWLGPVHQSMNWTPDAQGHWEYFRHVGIQRDNPGEDGGFADRMLGGIYRGQEWFFQLTMPGKIVSAEPVPSQIDSLSGRVEWVIPLALLTQKGIDFKVRTESVAIADSQRKPFIFSVICVLLGLGLLIWIRQRR
jgi:hypothetical protein